MIIKYLWHLVEGLGARCAVYDHELPKCIYRWRSIALLKITLAILFIEYKAVNLSMQKNARVSRYTLCHSRGNNQRLVRALNYAGFLLLGLEKIRANIPESRLSPLYGSNAAEAHFEWPIIHRIRCLRI